MMIGLNQAKTFHFCSNTLTTAHALKVTEYAVNKASHAGALISFDVNLRHNLWSTDKADIKSIQQLMKIANVIKLVKKRSII